jgi:hypothetical protein
MRQLSAASARPIPVSPYLYIPPKRRWWPLFACLGAGGVCALALLGSSQQHEGTGSTQKPLVYLFAKSDGLAPASRRSKPSIARSPSEGVRAPEAPAVPDTVADDPPTERPETAMVNVQASSAPSATRTAMAEAAPTRTKANAGRSTVKRSHTRVHRYAARKSQRQEVANYWRYGGYSWGGYGYNGNRSGGWFFN